MNVAPPAPQLSRARPPHADTGPGRPDADECLPYYFQYIDLVPDGHALETLERQIAESAAYLAGFTAAEALRREARRSGTPSRSSGTWWTSSAPSATARSVSRARIPSMWTQVEFGDWAAVANYEARLAR